MKVFVVLVNEDYEGYRIDEIFSNKRAATLYIKNQEINKNIEYTIEIHEVNRRIKSC